MRGSALALTEMKSAEDYNWVFIFFFHKEDLSKLLVKYWAIGYPNIPLQWLCRVRAEGWLAECVMCLPEDWLGGMEDVFPPELFGGALEPFQFDTLKKIFNLK